MPVDVNNPLTSSFGEDCRIKSMEVEDDHMVITSSPSRLESRLEAQRELSGLHGHGLGIGEIEYDHGDEPNGCDRCGCPDEQRCCPGFWNDRGVPPIWPLSWVFNPRNKHLNDNKYARMFGNFGFKFFDKERKAFMGTALAVTVLSMFITSFGLLTLSPNVAMLHATAWGVSSYRYENEDGKKIGIVTYIGLQKFAVSTCLHTENANYLSWKDCTNEGVWWSAVKCSSGEEDFYGFPCGPIGECGETSTNSQFGATMTCVTLIFAMIGCLTRMRKVADTNFQKMIGCFPDTLGIITQAQALALFSADCYDNMPVRSTTGDKIHYVVGAGYWAFVVCWLAAIIRASVHYCTPVPGGGVGCRFEDMQLAANEMNSLIEKAKVDLNKGMEKAKVDLNKGMEKVQVEIEKAKVDLNKGMEKVQVEIEKAKVDLNKGMEKVQEGFNEGMERVRKNTGAPLFAGRDNLKNEGGDCFEKEGLVDESVQLETGVVSSSDEVSKSTTVFNHQEESISSVAIQDETLDANMIENEIGP